MYRKSFEIIGYTYDADIHCVECTVAYANEKYPGVELTHDIYRGFGAWIIRDSEGNEIHPIFLDNYSDFIQDVDGPYGGIVAYPPMCSDCGEEIG